MRFSALRWPSRLVSAMPKADRDAGWKRCRRNVRLMQEKKIDEDDGDDPSAEPGIRGSADGDHGSREGSMTLNANCSRSM